MDPGYYVIDIDGTLLTAHSEKEGAAPTYKGGFGFHPLLAYLDRSGEPLAALLRPGNAGSGTASDHIAVLDAALAALVLLREKVLRPLLAAAGDPPTAPIRVKPGRKRSFWERVDYGYSRFRRDMHRLFRELHIVPPNRQTFADVALASA